MSDKTERPGAREGRRGLQSVVQLYLSRPPRELAWPEPEAETPPPPDERGRRSPGAAPGASVERGVEPPIEHAGGELEIERGRTRPLDHPGTELIDAATQAILERLDARIEAVSAIPLIDLDADEAGVGQEDADDLHPALADAGEVEVGWEIVEPADHADPDDRRVGAPVVDEATAKEFEDEVTVELIDDEETDDLYEAAPEPVLSGISLDIEDPLGDSIGPGAYAPLSGVASGSEDDEDIFSEDALPPQEIGSEALRAELAFKLEEHLDDSREATHEAPPEELPRDDPHRDTPLDEPLLESEIFFEEDGLTTEIPSDVAQATSVEEIFDLVDRSLALGPGPGTIEDSAVSPAQAMEKAGLELLPEVVEHAAAGHADVTEIAGDATAADRADVAAEDIAVEGVPAEDVAAEDVAEEDVATEEVTAALETTLPLTDVAGRILAPGTALETTRIALFLSTLPPRLRRRVLDTLGAPTIASGRRVLFLEPDPADDEAGGVIEEALGLETGIWRGSLGASPREILLMRPAQREQLFAGLAAEERRSQLVLLGVGLPETIFCPRMLPLVDTIVVGLTRQESSLYEAYRALRGLPERRPGLTPYAVTIASSAEEAALLLQRFRQISRDFLRSPVLDGGWLELAALPQGPPDAGAAASDEPRDGTRPGLDPALLRLLASPRGEPGDSLDPAASGREYDGRPERAFFERLAEWFGPLQRP